MPFMADVIQALGISGEEAGQLFTTLFKRGVDADALKEKLNNLAEIGDRLGDMSITQFAKFLPSLSETSGAALDNIEDMYIALNMLAKGTNRPQQALQQYQSAMDDFRNSADSIQRYTGFDVLNDDGELKGFAEIMETLSKFGEQTDSTAYFDKIFHLSDSTIKALRQYNNYYQETIENVGELGDTTNAIADRAGQNGGTIAASLNRLKSAASEFASSTLIKPVESLAALLNQHPRGMEYAVKGLAAAIAALALMKTFSTVISFIGNLKTLKDGGGVAGGLNAGGGAGIPVHVTNWGGAAGSTMMPGAGIGVPKTGGGTTPGALPSSPLESARSAVGNLTPKQYAAGAAGAGITAAVVKIPQMVNELEAIKQDETLTNKERGAAKGGAIGDATGSIIGAAAGGAAGIAAGAAVGAAVGSVVPVLGTAVGALVGAGIGALGMWLGGKAGRKIGEGIGGAVAGDDDLGVAIPSEAQGSAGVSQGRAAHRRQSRQVNDLIVTPSGEFNTHPEDYIFAMKDPSSLVNNEIRNEVRTIQFIPQAAPPVVVEGQIELKSELVINDKGYQLRQQIGKNTTPYKFAVGSAQNARLIQ